MIYLIKYGIYCHLAHYDEVEVEYLLCVLIDNDTAGLNGLCCANAGVTYGGTSSSSLLLREQPSPVHPSWWQAC